MRLDLFGFAQNLFFFSFCFKVSVSFFVTARENVPFEFCESRLDLCLMKLASCVYKLESLFLFMENPSELLGPNGLIRKDEFVRIIAQSLYSLGYNNSALQLELESGVLYKSHEFQLFETHVLNGNWDSCTTFLNSMKGVLFGNTDPALFLVLRQCFLEHLSRGEVALAFDVLRKQISVLHVNKSKVHNLQNAFFTLKDLNGFDVHSTRGELRFFFPPSISLPERQLQHLVESVVASSLNECMYHNSADPVSLYEDHHCCSDQIPNRTIQTLTGHRDKVWFVQFSNNGEFLASLSNDCTIIWKMNKHGNFSQVAKLGNLDAVSFVAWSTDDTKLLIYGNQILRLWDVTTGTCKFGFPNQGYVINSCAWYPNSTQFVWVCSGPGGGICYFNSDMNMNQPDRIRWRPNVTGFAFTPDGAHFICIFRDKRIWIHCIGSSVERDILEKHQITSVSVSKDSLRFIVNLSNQEIHMWDVAGYWPTPKSFVGHKQHERVIWSCIGGWNNNFIASGSEDWKVYIWNCFYPGNPILVLSEHSNIVNCVSWNPKRAQILASASDDGTIRIWGPQVPNT